MDSNPYKTPTAILETGARRITRALWWKIYFWFVLIVQSLYIVSIFVAPNYMEVKTSDYFDVVIYIGVLLGLYGFVYCKSIFSRKTWQLFFPFILLWDIWFIIIDGDWGEWLQAGLPVMIIMASVVLALMIPQYIALFRYGFREKLLWEQGK